MLEHCAGLCTCDFLHLFHWSCAGNEVNEVEGLSAHYCSARTAPSPFFLSLLTVDARGLLVEDGAVRGGDGVGPGGDGVVPAEPALRRRRSVGVGAAVERRHLVAPRLTLKMATLVDNDKEIGQPN